MVPEMKVVRLSGHMSVSVSTDAIQALHSLAANKSRIIMLSVDPEAEVIQLVPSSSDARPSTIEEIVHTISSTEPRFTFCRFGHEGDREHDVLLFFFTCPSPAEALSVQAIKRRMVYPLMKRAVLEVARTDAGLSVDKTLEVENPSQIDESLVLPELDVGQSERQGGG